MYYDNKIINTPPVTTAFELIVQLETYAPKSLFFLLHDKKNNAEAYRRIIQYFKEHCIEFSSKLNAFASLCFVTNLPEDAVDNLLDFAYQQNSWEYISLVSQSPSLKSIDTIGKIVRMEKSTEETLDLIRNIIANPNIPEETRYELKEWAISKYHEIPMELLPELDEEELSLFLPV